MAFTAKEGEIITRMQESPFSVTDEELRIATESVKRERGNREKQLRRKIRAYVANKFNWKFALDGGFMPNHGEPRIFQQVLARYHRAIL